MDPYQYLEPAASRVRDPLTGRSIWLAGLIQDAIIEDETLKFVIAVKPGHSLEDRGRMREALLRNLAERGWTTKIACELRGDSPTSATSAPPPAAAQSHNHGHDHQHGARPPAKDPVRGMSGPGMAPHGGPITKTLPDGVQHIIAVFSGKGGVGKSTVATNLAVALARAGYATGLLDADIYGPSLPLMMHVTGKPLASADKKIIPLVAHGVRCMSMGFLVDEREPIIWRGPMVMGVVNQFFKDVDWRGTDYLVVDLPPGTGDTQLTMIQAVPISGGVVVTTPQPVAVLDAVRGIEMFRKLDVPVLGIIENMSWMDVPGGGRVYPFGRDGGPKLAADYDVPLLGQVPLREGIRVGGDVGRPAVLDGEPAFEELARKVAAALPLRGARE